MSDEIKLRECPFCKGKAVVTSGDGEFWGKCTECNATTDLFANEVDAIAAWNRRPKPRTNLDKWREGLIDADLVDSIERVRRSARCKVCPVRKTCNIGMEYDGTTCSTLIQRWAAEAPDEG